MAEVGPGAGTRDEASVTLIVLRSGGSSSKLGPCGAVPKFVINTLKCAIERTRPTITATKPLAFDYVNTPRAPERGVRNGPKVSRDACGARKEITIWLIAAFHASSDED